MDKKSRFCARCGKPDAMLADSICTDCSFADLEVRVPKTVSLVKCKSCGKINFEGIWLEDEEPDRFYFENLLVKKIRPQAEMELKNVSISEVPGNADVTATLGFNGKEFTKTVPIALEIKNTICEVCSARKRDHYEAKIQLRVSVAHKEEFEEMLELVKEFKTHILKMEKQPAGIDIFLTSKQAARHLAAELRKDFDLKTKESGDAYGWDKFKSRPRYRLIISMRERNV